MWRRGGGPLFACFLRTSGCREYDSEELTAIIWKKREVPATFTFCSSLFILPGAAGALLLLVVVGASPPLLLLLLHWMHGCRFCVGGR